jgi:hypothetical protein
VLCIFLPPEPLPPPYHLREVQVSILNNSRCQELFEIFSLHHLITKDVFCAGAEDGSADTCSVSLPAPLRKPPSPSLQAGELAPGLPSACFCFICEKSFIAFNYPAYKPTSHFPLMIVFSIIPETLRGGKHGPTFLMKSLRLCGCQGKTS